MSRALEIRLVDRQWQAPLARFFTSIKRSGDDRFFLPHPLTPAYAARLGGYRGKDLYYVLVEGRTVLGYGMLRGWDEGYDIPSLGIAIRDSRKGQGLGKCLLLFLHTAARQRGAARVRLRVHEENGRALALYKGFGYRFESREMGQLVGVKDLGALREGVQ